MLAREDRRGDDLRVQRAGGQTFHGQQPAGPQDVRVATFQGGTARLPVGVGVKPDVQAGHRGHGRG